MDNIEVVETTQRWSYRLIIAIFLSISLLLTSCPEPTNNIKRDTTITLELLSTWTTSVRLNVAVTDTTDTWTFELTRDDSVVVGVEVLGSDTVVVDGGLNPGTEYSYRAFFIDEGVRVDTSETITAVTMDTTSHDFVWEIDTLESDGSYLNDVAIINENNIWVVGNIVTDSMEYNAAHWNGSEWELELIGVPGVIGEGIYYFTEDDIWVTTGIIYHWNGEEWERYHLWDMGVLGPNDGGVSKIWGESPSNIYFVGRKGSIVHYDGSSFTKMESGTDSPLRDIWGINEDNVWSVGYTNTIDEDHPDGYENVLLFYDGQGWTKQYVSPGYFPILPDTLSSRIHAVWGYDDSLYVTCVGGLWIESVMERNGYLTKQQDLGAYDWFLSRVKGNGHNDVFIMSAFGQVTHFNGRSWRVIYDLTEQFYDPPALSWSLAVKGGVVVFVGLENQSGKALVVRGYRE